MKEEKRISNEDILTKAVNHREELLNEVQETNHRIIEYLVENHMTQFFSVNWGRLSRHYLKGRSKLD